MLKGKKTDKFVVTGLFFCAVCLLAFVILASFLYYTSPFSSCDNGYDAAFFRLVGQGMTRGYLPYRDFFDMKGPFLFFIEYIGQEISYGRWGIFIIQWVNLILILFIICKLFEYCQITNKVLHIILLLPLIYVASYTFEGGNLTEEFSLLPIFLCLYTCLVFFDKCEDPSRYWQRRFYWHAGMLFGFCFGLLLMIRITNAAFICAMIITVMIYFIGCRKYYQLSVCIGMFIIGFIISVAPAIIFYSSNGLLYEMLNAMFVLGYKYSGEKSFLQHVIDTVFTLRNQQLLLLAIPCCITFLLHWRSWKERCLVCLGTLFTFFAVASGNNYTHYYTLAIPLLAMCEIAIIESIQIKIRKREIVAIVSALVMYISQYPIMREYLFQAYSHLFLQNRYNTIRLVQDISSKIPDNGRASVFCYNIDPSWYTYANLFPCIKYCGWQNHYISLMPEIYDDLENAFSEKPPTWLILPENQEPLPSFLEEMLTNDYSWVYENDSYILYHYSESILD